MFESSYFERIYKTGYFVLVARNSEMRLCYIIGGLKMKRFLLLAGLFLASNAMGAAFYCSCARYESETRFDGTAGTTGSMGAARYFGVNNTFSLNVGTYLFKTDNDLIIEFPGEQRHFCTKASPNNWACKRGKLKYSLLCEF
jgi:hypothetical protein